MSQTALMEASEEATKQIVSKYGDAESLVVDLLCTVGSNKLLDLISNMAAHRTPDAEPMRDPLWESTKIDCVTAIQELADQFEIELTAKLTENGFYDDEVA